MGFIIQKIDSRLKTATQGLNPGACFYIQIEGSFCGEGQVHFIVRIKLLRGLFISDFYLWSCLTTMASFAWTPHERRPIPKNMAKRRLQALLTIT